MTLLDVQSLSVRYSPRDGTPMDAVREVTFQIAAGEMVGLVGESGSGKSTLGNALLQLLAPPASLTGGSVFFDGRDLGDTDQEELRRLRWVDLSTVFQSSMNSLNPVLTVGAQFEDTFAAHGAEGGKERAAKLLDLVDLEPAVLSSYPHELSGGMKQRVALALALALEPSFVLLDEPTTGLDVLVQRRILDRLRALQSEFGFAVLFISHDIGTVMEIADRVMVMYRGQLVETGDARAVLRDPQHEYTKALLNSYAASHEIAEAQGAEDAPVVLELTDVHKTYRTGRGRTRSEVTAVDGVSLALRRGRVTALVGQSGSGKSTIGRVLLGMERPDAGEVRFLGEDGGAALQVGTARGRALRDYRRHVQLVFQDPYSSLNPTRTVAYALSRPLMNYGGATRATVRQRSAELLEQVGLTPAENYLDKLPAQLSGGQRQRVVIARALAPDPEVLIADEPISSLDVSIRASILELLDRLVKERGLAMLYITHDLLSARSLAHEVIVLRRAVAVETGDTRQVTTRPSHEYTRELIEAIPDPYERGSSASGSVVGETSSGSAESSTRPPGTPAS